MKETRFIRQNEEKWKAFEELSASRHKDSAQYSKLFIQITDDLSYARTFYPNRSVRIYLNHLAQDIFQRIFSRNRKRKSFVRDFWMEELPAVLYRHRSDLLISLLVLILALLIGLLSFLHDPAFANKILGDSYMAMTAENIAKKDPMAVYKQMPPIQMFVQIVLNNLKVDILTFFSGLLFSIGSILVTFYNGLMLSAFQAYFIKQGLFRESFLAIWLHGTLEISAMVICGAAGIVLGKGLAFPGTYSRTQSFFSAAQRASKIFFSVLPITFTAAIIESFLTRYTETPDSIRLALILSSLCFILGYYVFLPIIKKRNGSLREPEMEKVLPEHFPPFTFYAIKEAPEILLDSFRIFRKYSGLFFGIILRYILLLTICGVLLNKSYLLKNAYDSNWSFSSLEHFIVADPANWFSLLLPLLFTEISLRVTYIFYRETQESRELMPSGFRRFCKERRKAVVLAFLLQLCFYALLSFSGLNTFSLIFLIPFQFLITFPVFFPFQDQKNFFSAFFKSTRNGLFQLLLLNLVLLFMGMLIFLFINLFIFGTLYDAVTLNLSREIVDGRTFFLVFFLLSASTIISSSLIFFSVSQAVFYFSQKEKHTAEGLILKLQSLPNISERNAGTK